VENGHEERSGKADAIQGIVVGAVKALDHGFMSVKG
jgi:hypothetical protein